MFSRFIMCIVIGSLLNNKSEKINLMKNEYLIYQQVHLAIKKWKNNIKSKLFSLASGAKIAHYLYDDSQIKIETDQELLNLLNSIAAKKSFAPALKNSSKNGLPLEAFAPKSIRTKAKLLDRRTLLRKTPILTVFRECIITPIRLI